MISRTIAIGDIHGCTLALDALIHAINPQPADTIITLGDVVNKGPDSKGVIDRLIELSGRCNLVPLLGNHDLFMLAVRSRPEWMDGWIRYGGGATLASYGGLDAVPDEHWRFLESCRIFHETSSHIFMHANYDETLPMAEQSMRMLLWTSLWRHQPRCHCSGKMAVVGHTALRTVFDIGHLLAIDTDCARGGLLTAVDVLTGEQWQADRNGKSRVSKFSPR